jgi:hypothetical protein
LGAPTVTAFLSTTRPLLLPLHPDIVRLPHARPRVRSETRLEDWIFENGGMLYNARCKVMPESGGRGLVTTGPIQYKQTYITVPENLWYHEKTAKQHSDIAHILDTDKQIEKECGKKWGERGEPCRLILGLMYETVKKNSFWKAYIDTFPTHPTSPVWYVALYSTRISLSPLSFLRCPSFRQRPYFFCVTNHQITSLTSPLFFLPFDVCAYHSVFLGYRGWYGAYSSQVGQGKAGRAWISCGSRTG